MEHFIYARVEFYFYDKRKKHILSKIILLHALKPIAEALLPPHIHSECIDCFFRWRKPLISQIFFFCTWIKRNHSVPSADFEEAVIYIVVVERDPSLVVWFAQFVTQNLLFCIVEWWVMRYSVFQKNLKKNRQPYAWKWFMREKLLLDSAYF